MAMAFNPFSEEGRDRRLGQPQPYSQYPGGAAINPNVNVPVGNPEPLYEPAASLPNQLNIDSAQAYPLLEDFEDYYIERDNQGLGFLPLPTPLMDYNEQRDPVTGHYDNVGWDIDWSGVPGAVRGMQELYMEPIVGRANAVLPAWNDDRQAVQDVAQPVSYQTERPVQNINPNTGQSYTTFTGTTRFQPFFPLESLFL